MRTEDVVKIVNFELEHVEAAADIFIGTYRTVKKSCSLLPDKYMNKDVIQQLLKRILKDNDGVVAISNNRVVGYLTGFIIPNFKSSHPGVYTPEWGHSVSHEDARNLYELMINTLFDKWLEKECVVHAITHFSHDYELTNKLFWSGYGMFVVDAVREPSHLNIETNDHVAIKTATSYDVKQIVELMKEHTDYMSSPPTFLPNDGYLTVKDVAGWLDHPNRVVRIAKSEGNVIGIMNTVTNATNACTVVRDTTTLTIKETHVTKSAKGLGVGKLLLQDVNQYAIQNGFERISVDFESANLEAMRFWLKHFESICFSVIRYIDDTHIKTK
ncbi:GNAT family N-acetyltransferase [Bacillus sp. HMF5848]|uniref:GNAT family N-acetyltransferase n=1 Tax=Bacillus sp. HMF5848 TaxID=2495421 RepID=UPI000F7B0581|nr:GNAT family N-acetyltransferase [Bacillus sp. HMF5848]RSK27549.1 GNAT family N-acetyltransferase [Bacillus sp. HMF5848]